MAAIMGLGNNAVAFVPGPAGTAPAAGRANPATSSGQSPTTHVPAVIDGTPVRVVVLAGAAAAGLWALHLSGFRFNVAVSG